MIGFRIVANNPPSLIDRKRHCIRRIWNIKSRDCPISLPQEAMLLDTCAVIEITGALPRGVDRQGYRSDKATRTSIERCDCAIRIPQEPVGNVAQINPVPNNLSQRVYVLRGCNSPSRNSKCNERAVRISPETELQVARIEVRAEKADNLPEWAQS